MSIYQFPENFIWGTATASYQIEGAFNQDGRSLSTWDVFSKTKGNVLNGDTGDVACDHYHRYEEDFSIMQKMGFRNYRFSIAWPRILPEGSGAINSKGIDFYNKIIDSLLEKNIEPYVTCFHWDLPQILEDKYGGWRNKDTAKLFQDYVAILVDNFSDRVSNWMTINEISCFTILGYRECRHAPGIKSSEQVVNQSVHNALLGHGLAMETIRERSKTKAQVGLVENMQCTWPIYDTEEHIEAARKAWKDMNQQILFPLFTGEYSKEYLQQLGTDAPEFTDEEMRIISQPMDFIGHNIYTASPVRANPNSDKGYEIVSYPKSYHLTHISWPVSPKSIYYALVFARKEFGNIPVFVTENGVAFDDRINENSEIIDLDRKEFLRSHLQSLWEAIEEGCPVKGYFLWSFLDNFEWSYGYSQRFGIVHVDYNTLKRTPKLSAKYYSEVIKANKVL